MRLKDKQTGKVGDYFLTNQKREKIAVVPNGKSPTEGFIFDSLKEMCEQFEDAPDTRPFEEAAEAKFTLTLSGSGEPIELKIADQDYYEILPDGTKKTEFTWDEAMEIEKKTHGKWRVPTQAEWYVIAAAFGADEKGEVTGATLAKNLNLTTGEDGCGYYWSSIPASVLYGRALYLYRTYADPQYYNDKVNGFTVRCVSN